MEGATQASSIEYTPAMLAARGLFSGFVIAVAVAMTKAGGALLGGMFAMFPAVFVATLAIAYFSHGPLFSAALMKSSILGAVGVVIYGVGYGIHMCPLGYLGEQWFRWRFFLRVRFLSTGLLR